MIGKILLTIFITIAALLLARGLYEPHRLEVRSIRIGTGMHRIRVLLLSDIHASFFFIRQGRLEALLREHLPDAVLFAGDLTNGIRDLPKGLSILSGISRTAAELGIPCYGVPGNHDRPGFGARLEAIGFWDLANRSDWITTKDGGTWHLIGLEDYRKGRPSYRDAKSHHRTPPPSGSTKPNHFPEIILAHNPESILDIIADRREHALSHQPESTPDSIPDRREHALSHQPKSTPDSIPDCREHALSHQPESTPVLLSGHFHGGQIWMPFNIEYTIMRHETMAKAGYRKGYYERAGIRGYISRGLGCVLVPFRLLSLPEAVIIDVFAG
jgi:uncharacterized protein